jgi:multiple sugar transport system permease protein
MSLETGVKTLDYHKRRKIKELIIRVIVTIILLGGTIALLGPLWWMVSTSLKSMSEIGEYPPTFIPKKIYWENYKEAWTSAPFTLYMLNTLFISFFCVVGNVVSNSLIAYGFAKIKFPGRKLLFGVVLATMMIPSAVTLVPTYILFAKIHWVGTFLPLIVPVFFGSSFNIFLFRQFYMTIPNELGEAARIDGANHFYIWLKLMIPITKPVLATVAIFSFNGAWNDFMGPLLYLQREAQYTLQIGLQVFRTAQLTQWNYLMAASVIVLLPVVALFAVFQNYFIQGMNLTAGTKG